MFEGLVEAELFRG